MVAPAVERAHLYSDGISAPQDTLWAQLGVVPRPLGCCFG